MNPNIPSPAAAGEGEGALTFPATAKLAEFAHDFRLEHIPEQALDRAKLLILDNLGVALAAVPLPIGQKILSYVQSLGGQPQATIWGATAQRTAAPLAALANGTLSSALDFDAGFHLTTHTLPAAIAAGEHANASGAVVLEAFIAAYEIGARLIEARRFRPPGGWRHHRPRLVPRRLRRPHRLRARRGQGPPSRPSPAPRRHRHRRRRRGRSAPQLRRHG